MNNCESTTLFEIIGNIWIIFIAMLNFDLVINDHIFTKMTVHQTTYDLHFMIMISLYIIKHFHASKNRNDFGMS